MGAKRSSNAKKNESNHEARIDPDRVGGRHRDLLLSRFISHVFLFEDVPAKDRKPRASKNAIFGPNSLPGFWTQGISLMTGQAQGPAPTRTSWSRPFPVLPVIAVSRRGNPLWLPCSLLFPFLLYPSKRKRTFIGHIGHIGHFSGKRLKGPLKTSPPPNTSRSCGTMKKIPFGCPMNAATGTWTRSSSGGVKMNRTGQIWVDQGVNHDRLRIESILVLTNFTPSFPRSAWEREEDPNVSYLL